MDFYEAIYNLYCSSIKNVNIYLEYTIEDKGKYFVDVQLGGTIIIKRYISGHSAIIGPECGSKEKQIYYIKAKVIKAPLELAINEVNTENMYNISIRESNIEIMYIHIERSQ